MTSEIEDRRQRAFEAYADHPHEEGGVENAIEVATQVKITSEIREAISLVEDAFGRKSYQAAVARIFEAAGFEVIE